MLANNDIVTSRALGYKGCHERDRFKRSGADDCGDFVEES